MISADDLDLAIESCLNERNPDVNTCLRLAAFYIIKDHIAVPEDFSPPAEIVGYEGRSEFMQKVDGKSTDEVWAIIDELMETLTIVNPRLYEGVMRKLM